jgi:hypothetical protein
VASVRALVLLAVVCLMAAQSAAAAQTTPTAAQGLGAYRTALNSLPPLGNLVFQYTEVRSGPARALSEEHRVYRSAGGSERNETIVVNGMPVVPALVRFSASDAWPYDVRRFVVDETEYNVMYLGATTVAGKRVIGFSTVRATPGDFAITGLYLDPVRHLPVRVTFDTGGGGCRGQGAIDFAPIDSRWLPVAVNVSCTVAPGGETFRETIKFSAYQFPQVIPADVFGAKQ